ncbi:aminotransferase class IV [Castellaniella caeni]|uniref:aminotransferase class IV n=1 Tax=Castellaniella caeni TaxID=266123 RepID=UPI002155C474|nr:aminotransferase class IV [Castellaniella caeni]
MTPNDLPSLIETMRLQSGRIALWPWHRARLLASARALGYPLDVDALDARIAEALGPSRRATAGTAPPAGTPGDIVLHGTAATNIATHEAAAEHPGDIAQANAAQTDAAWRARLLLAPDGQVTLDVQPLPPTASPVSIALARDAGVEAPERMGHRYLSHKTTHRPWFVGAQGWLQTHPQYFDLIFCDARGNVCEGSRSNLYAQDEQARWLTPPLACGLLPGVQRQWLLEHGLVQEAHLSSTDLRAAPALRVSNALRGWLDARLRPWRETQAG